MRRHDSCGVLQRLVFEFDQILRRAKLAQRCMLGEKLRGFIQTPMRFGQRQLRRQNVKSATAQNAALPQMRQQTLRDAKVRYVGRQMPRHCACDFCAASDLRAVFGCNRSHTTNREMLLQRRKRKQRIPSSRKL